MVVNFSEINFFNNPSIGWLKATPTDFLHSLSGPSVVDIKGKDQNRCRVITTLIHGNEPSGLIASHRWLTEAVKLNIAPATNIRFIFASVEAAQCQPTLSHRYLPSGQDLNRCFGTQYSDGYYQRANMIEDAIHEVQPEAVVDLHNTSGYGPAFSVSPGESEDELSLTSLFSESLILSNMALGALMEQNYGCPVITVECGGRDDQQSHEIAYQGINQLCTFDNISDCHHLNIVEVIEQPLRVQLKPDVSLNFGNSKCQNERGVTLKSYIEQLNVGVTCQGRVLGWLDSRGLDNLCMFDETGVNVIADYFDNNQGELTSRHNLRLFMATSNAEIAKSDCLFYAVKSKSSHMPLS